MTQNVDNLHRRSGTKNIIKLHGDILSVRCHGCKSNYINEDSPIDESFNKYEDFIDDFLDPKNQSNLSDIDLKNPILPLKFCPKCNSIQRIRPNIVWFGESLDENVLSKCYEKIEICDLYIIIGTSSVVYPAAGFVDQVAENGRKAAIAEINLQNECEGYDHILRINGKSGEILPVLCDELEKLFSEN